MTCDVLLVHIMNWGVRAVRNCLQSFASQLAASEEVEGMLDNELTLICTSRKGGEV